MLPPMASEAPKERRYWAGARLAPAAPALLTLLVAIAIIASGRGGPSEATDQDIYHLVVIRGMVDQWPAIDVVNYPSATSPGYHALMTLVAVATPGEGSDLLAMRLATALLGALVPALAGLLAARWVGPWVAAALAAPLAVNSYVLGGAAYLTTDNLAYALILATLAAALARPAPAAGVAGGLAAAALVAVRQVHVWVVAPLGLAALLASPLARRLPGKWRFEATRWSPLAAATVGVTLALGVLGAFVAAWGGLTPPSDAAAKHAMGPNPASPAMALAMFAIAAIPLAWAALPELRRGSLRWTLAGGAIGLASALATPTSFELKRRAYGWVWTVVRETPAPAERAPARADITRQLANLTPPGFLATAPWSALSRYPVYFAAMRERLSRLAGAERRDAELQAQVRPFEDAMIRKAQEHAQRGIVDPELERLRWMIEEFRVSLWAQKLGTAESVSGPRLEKQWAKVR